MRIYCSFLNACVDDSNPLLMPCYYQSFLKGLSEAGHVVRWLGGRKPYDCLHPEHRVQIEDDLRTFAPDLVIAFNNYGPDFASLVDCPIAVYEVDSCLYYFNREALTRDPGRYHYFIGQEPSRPLVQRMFAAQPDRVVLYPPFSEVRARDIEQDINVSFVGSRFWGASAWPWTRRLAAGDIPDVAAYRKLLQSIAAYPFMGWEGVENDFPGLIKENEYGELIDAISAEKRIQTLGAIADLGLHLYGTKDWATCGGENADLALSYSHRRVVSLDSIEELYNRSKVCINITHAQAVDGFSWRVCDIMASNGCLLSEKKADLLRLFPDVPIPTFSNKYEAREQCKRLLADVSRRREIVLGSQAAIDRNFRFSRVLHNLASGLDMPLDVETGTAGSVTAVPCMNWEDHSGEKNARSPNRSKIARYAFKLSLYALLRPSKMIMTMKRIQNMMEGL